jgi:hypothetical protein
MFFDLCPETALRETRSVVLTDEQYTLPLGEYTFIDFYCDDPRCDCRRAIIQVRSEDDKLLATLNYGWESKEFYNQWMGGNQSIDDLAGVSLEPSSVQSEHCLRIKELFEHLLATDSEYANRFPQHYLEFKRVAAAGRQTSSPARQAPRRQMKARNLKL